MAREDYGIEHSTIDVELSYLPTDLSVDCPHVVMMNNRQVSNFLSYCKKKNTVKLCVTFNGGVEDKGGKEKSDLNKKPDSPSDGDACFNADEKVLGRVVEEDKQSDIELAISPKKRKHHHGASDGVGSSSKSFSVRKEQYFRSKDVLKATMELYAMKYNCDYKITKSYKKFWCIQCVDVVCKWSLRAEHLERSMYFKVNKFVDDHSCVLESPKPNDISNIIRTQYGHDLTYHQAWEAPDPDIGVNLEDANVTKWARCHFPGYRYDININNPTESINSALRSPRVYPFDIGKLPCTHAIKGAYDIGKCIYPFADDVYTTATWRSLYEETINPIGIPEEEWHVPEDVESAVVLPPETRRQSGRRKNEDMN
ncbi:unnamed protein product [Arabidopsis thaliana]|uniref:(thale cress) hypothetical protein n=1 Tax=Arabidopsis thaliana TaxID=3702 RepID=A0A7G2EBR3_ARATH|nr:unnamed protein product [Arabidopsis thaliana]